MNTTLLPMRLLPAVDPSNIEIAIEEEKQRLMRLQVQLEELLKMNCDTQRLLAMSGGRLSFPVVGRLIDAEILKHFCISRAYWTGYAKGEEGYARMTSYWLMKKLTNAPREVIGVFFKKNGSTISCGIKSVEDRMSIEPKFKAMVEMIKDTIEKQLSEQQ